MKTILLAMTAVLVSTVAASACDPVYKKVVCYETVFVIVVKTVPFEKEVIRYDECGKPVCVTVIAYKEVAVKVAKVVEVVKYVKASG